MAVTASAPAHVSPGATFEIEVFVDGATPGEGLTVTVSHDVGPGSGSNQPPREGTADAEGSGCFVFPETAAEGLHGYAAVVIGTKSGLLGIASVSVRSA